MFGKSSEKPVFGFSNRQQSGFSTPKSETQFSSPFGQAQSKPQQGGLFGQQQQSSQQDGLFGQLPPKPQQTPKQGRAFGQRKSTFQPGNTIGSNEPSKDKFVFTGFGKPKESPVFGKSASHEASGVASTGDSKDNTSFGIFENASVGYDMSKESEKKLLNTLTLQKNVKSAVVLIYKSEKHTIYALASTVNDEAFSESLEKVTNLKINEVTSYDLQNLKPLTANNITPIMERLELFKSGSDLKINMKKGVDYLPAGEYLFFSYRITLFSLTKWEVTKYFTPETFMSVEDYKDTVAKGIVSRLLFTNELQKSRFFFEEHV